MIFSDTFIKNLKPTGTAYRKFEKGIIKGFGLQVTAKGTISFFLCYALEGKTLYKTLGSYPRLSLAKARLEAEAFRSKIDLEKANSKDTGTLSALFEAYLSQKTLEGKRTVPEMERSFNYDVLPYLAADLPANEVTAQDIKLILHRVYSRGSMIQANRLRSYLRAAFHFGMQHDNDPLTLTSTTEFKLTSNPVDFVPPGTRFETVGDRTLTLEELRRVWFINEETTLSLKHVSALRLMILFTGLRPSEVTQAKVKEFDMEKRIWSIPPERTKNGKWHVLPLPGLAFNLIQDLMGWFVGSEYLIPSVNIHKPEIETSLTHGVKRVLKTMDMVYWTPRDLRRTCKTWAGMAGLSKEIRDRLLNHASSDVSSKHYDRYLYLYEKLEALQKWEDYLLKEIINK
jgi:integrase